MQKEKKRTTSTQKKALVYIGIAPVPSDITCRIKSSAVQPTKVFSEPHEIVTYHVALQLYVNK
jgi:hypothetical protein